MTFDNKITEANKLGSMMHILTSFYPLSNSTDGYNGTFTNTTISDENAIESGSSTESVDSDTSDEGVSVLSVIILSVVLLGIIIGVSSSYYRKNNLKDRTSFTAVNPIQTDPHLNVGNEHDEDENEGGSGETFSLVGKNIHKSTSNEV